MKMSEASPLEIAAPTTRPERAPSRARPRTPRNPATALVSVLIPVYNEQDTIEAIVDLVHSSPVRKEIICVDDCSTDSTGQILAELLAAGRIDKLDRHPVNRGKGAAETS